MSLNQPKPKIKLTVPVTSTHRVRHEKGHETHMVVKSDDNIHVGDGKYKQLYPQLTISDYRPGERITNREICAQINHISASLPMEDWPRRCNSPCGNYWVYPRNLHLNIFICSKSSSLESFRPDSFDIEAELREGRNDDDFLREHPIFYPVIQTTDQFYDDSGVTNNCEGAIDKYRMRYDTTPKKCRYARLRFNPLELSMSKESFIRNKTGQGPWERSPPKPKDTNDLNSNCPNYPKHSYLNMDFLLIKRIKYDNVRAYGYGGTDLEAIIKDRENYGNQIKILFEVRCDIHEKISVLLGRQLSEVIRTDYISTQPPTISKYYSPLIHYDSFDLHKFKGNFLNETDHAFPYSNEELKGLKKVCETASLYPNQYWPAFYLDQNSSDFLNGSSLIDDSERIIPNDTEIVFYGKNLSHTKKQKAPEIILRQKTKIIGNDYSNGHSYLINVRFKNSNFNSKYANNNSSSSRHSCQSHNNSRVITNQNIITHFNQQSPTHLHILIPNFYQLLEDSGQTLSHYYNYYNNSPPPIEFVMEIDYGQDKENSFLKVFAVCRSSAAAIGSSHTFHQHSLIHGNHNHNHSSNNNGNANQSTSIGYVSGNPESPKNKVQMAQNFNGPMIPPSSPVPSITSQSHSFLAQCPHQGHHNGHYQPSPFQTPTYPAQKPQFSCNPNHSQSHPMNNNKNQNYLEPTSNTDTDNPSDLELTNTQIHYNNNNQYIRTEGTLSDYSNMNNSKRAKRKIGHHNWDNNNNRPRIHSQPHQHAESDHGMAYNSINSYNYLVKSNNDKDAEIQMLRNQLMEFRMNENENNSNSNSTYQTVSQNQVQMQQNQNNTSNWKQQQQVHQGSNSNQISVNQNNSNDINWNLNQNYY